MALDDEVVLEAKAASFSQSSSAGWSRVIDILLKAPAEDVLDAFGRRCRTGLGILEYAKPVVHALGSAARSEEEANAGAAGILLLRIVLKVLEVVHLGGVLSDKEAQECISVLAQEMQTLPVRSLPSVTDSILKNVQQSEASCSDEFFSLELLPTCLRLISSSAEQVAVSGEGEEGQLMDGEEYVDKFIECLVGMQWSNSFTRKTASLIRELPLAEFNLERLVKKLLGCMKSLEPQDLPSLVYQLLLLASKGLRQKVLDGILGFFTRFQKEQEKAGNRALLDVIDQVVGTVVLHINFAVKQDPALGQELLSLLRSSQQPLSPFMISALLSVARIQRFEQASLDILKNLVLTTYRNSQHCRDSKWAFLVLGKECSQRESLIQQSLMETVEMNAFGWEHVAPSLVKTGFLLIDSAAPKGIDLSWSQNLGVQILINAFKVHEIARDEIIEQSKCRVVGLRRQQGYPIIRMIHQLVQACPMLMLDHGSRLKECLDYFTYLHPCAASLLIQAMCPLFALSADLQNYAILVLRKAMFSRETSTRMTAVEGLLDIMISEKQSTVDVDPLRSESEASCSQSCSQRSRSGKGRELFAELLGLFRRCLSQQVGVKEVLYRSLPKLLLVNPEVSNIVFDLLWQHFSRFYEAGQDNKASLKLGSCVTVRDGVVQTEEPLDQLMCCIRQLLNLRPQKANQQGEYAWTCFGFSLSQNEEELQILSGESLSVAFSNLRRGMQDVTLSTLGLDKLESGATDSSEIIDRSYTFQGILEVFINAATLETQNTSEQDAAEEIRRYVLLHECLTDKLSKKPGKCHGKPPAKASTSEQGTQKNKINAASSRPRKQLLSVACISRLLRITVDLEPASEGSIMNNGTNLMSFTLKACLRHFRDAESEISSRSLLGEDWTLVAGPLLKVLLSLKSALGVPQANVSKDKPSKKKKTGGGDGSMLLALRCLKAVLEVADERHSLDSLLKIVVPGFCEETEEEAECEQRRLDWFLSEEFAPLLQLLLRHLKDAEVEVAAGIFLFLGSRLPLSLMEKHGVWANRICQGHCINNPAVARALAKLATALSPSPADADITLCMATEVLKVMGTEEMDAVDSSDKYLIINQSTRNAVAGELLHQVETMVSDIEWLISILKSQDKARQHLNNRLKQEESLHTRLEGLVLVLSEFMQMALPDTIAEQVLKNAVRVYKSLAAATRLCIAGKGVKQATPSNRFQKLAEITCKKLTRPLYTFVAIVQRDQQENMQDKGAAKKIKRESKTIPNLIYQVEDYEKNLIQLSKLTKVNLMRHAKRSTARDFKIIEKPEDEEPQAAAAAPAACPVSTAGTNTKRRFKHTATRDDLNDDDDASDASGEEHNEANKEQEQESPKRQRTE